jgi:TP901 family phage tail tape measure protein
VALNSLGLGFLFTARDMASGVMRRVEGRFKKLDATTEASAMSMRKAMVGLGAGFVTAAAGAAGLGVAFKAASAFGEFDASLAKVQGRIGASAQDMKILEDRAKKAGIETEFSPVEAVQGLEELTAKGLNATDAAVALGGALDLAAAGQISVAQASNTVVAAMNVFGISADKAGETADKLLKVTSMTALSAGDMELSMGNLSRGVSQTNQEFEDMLVLTGLVKNTGVDVSVAATSISSALLAVGKNADKFEKLGIKVTDAEGNFKSLQDVMVDADNMLRNRFPDAADRAKNGYELFTKFGLTSFGAIMKQVNTGLKDQNGEIIRGAGAIQNYINRVKDAEGFGAAARKAKEDTLPGQLKLLKGSLSTLAIEFGRSFSDVFKPIVKGIKNFVNIMISVMTAIPGPVKKVLAGIVVLVSGILVLTGVGIMLAAAFVLIKMAVVAFIGVLAPIAGAIAIVSGAVLALVGVFKTIKMGFDENVGGFADGMREIFGRVKLYFDAISQLMGGDGKLRGDVLKKLLDPTNKGVLTMVQRFQQARHRFSQFFRGLKEGFKGVVTAAGPTFTRLKAAFAKLAEVLGFGGKAMGLMTSNSERFRGTGADIGEIIGRVMVIAVEFLVAAIRVATVVIAGMKLAWSTLKPILMVVAFGFGILFKVINVVIAVIQFLVGVVMEVFSVVTDVITTFIDFIAGTVNEGMGLLFGLLEQGLQAIENFADAIANKLDIFGDFTDAIADLNAGLMEFLGLSEKVDRAKRGAQAFSTLEEAAGKRGLTVDKYLDVRSKEVAGEQTARDMGLSAAIIRDRMSHGEEAIKALSPEEMKKYGVSGVNAKRDGEVEAGAANTTAMREAVAGGVQDADARRRKGKKVGPPQVKVVLGSEVVPGLAELKAEMEANDFGGAA